MNIITTVKPYVADTMEKMEKKTIGKKIIKFLFTFRKINWQYKNLKDSSIFVIKNIHKFYQPKTKVNRGLQIKLLFSKINIEIPESGFIYNIDVFKTLFHEHKLIDNIAVDYTLILNNSLENLKKKYEMCDVKNSEYIVNQLNLIEALEDLLNREIIELKKSNRSDKDKYISFLENIKYKDEVSSLEEGLQRILFFNQIIWQIGQNAIGLGRLDKVLDEIYENDDSITKEDGLNLIKSFLKSLNKNYWFKSNALLGDTGQSIILGGEEEDGTYFYNELTSLFIKANAELNETDPKIVLRVSNNTPRFLIEESLKSISTGIGNPLFSNDDVVIPSLINFGYDAEDAYNYTVSACWEPAPLRKGMEVNNLKAIIFLEPMNELLDNENLDKIDTFDKLIEKYEIYLERHIVDLVDEMNSYIWEEDPILSLFIEDCNKNQVDISKGGTKYNNVGLTTVSLSNTVNSLLNIKKLVFDEGKYTLNELNTTRKNNYNENDDLYNYLKNNKKFGNNDNNAIELTNKILNFTSSILNKYPTQFGGKYKFGLSGPTYISNGEMLDASLDGRKDKESLTVHISQETHVDYTSLINFSSKIKYEYAFNGNVTDFIVNPSFINENFDKFTDFIILSIKSGIFQMQMNVVSSETLINAKKNPENYTDLIVRVWGFSAYFNDLPQSFQDVLIHRALLNEGKISS